jgi:hypothetical protein
MVSRASWRQGDGDVSTKCNEERGNVFLPLLSHQKQNSSCMCLFCWMLKSLCTVAECNFAFAFVLLESV